MLSLFAKLGAGQRLLRECFVEQRRYALPRELLRLVPPLHQALLLLALALAELELEFLELTQQTVAEALLLGRELSFDPLALRPAPGLEPLGFLAAPSLEFGVQPHLGRLVAPPRLDELNGERAVETLGELARLLVRPKSIRFLASTRHRFALEAKLLGQTPLGFGALQLHGLHELGSPRAHLGVEALESVCPTAGELGGESSGGGVDDLGGRLFGHRV